MGLSSLFLRTPTALGVGHPSRTPLSLQRSLNANVNYSLWLHLLLSLGSSLTEPRELVQASANDSFFAISTHPVGFLMQGKFPCTSRIGPHSGSTSQPFSTDHELRPEAAGLPTQGCGPWLHCRFLCLRCCVGTYETSSGHHPTSGGVPYSCVKPHALQSVTMKAVRHVYKPLQQEYAPLKGATPYMDLEAALGASKMLREHHAVASSLKYYTTDTHG